MGFQADLLLQERADAVSSDREISFNRRTVREGQLHAIACFPRLRQAMTELERTLRLQVSKQFQKFRAMNIEALDAGGRKGRDVDRLAN